VSGRDAPVDALGAAATGFEVCQSVLEIAHHSGVRFAHCGARYLRLGKDDLIRNNDARTIGEIRAVDLDLMAEDVRQHQAGIATHGVGLGHVAIEFFLLIVRGLVIERLCTDNNAGRLVDGLVAIFPDVGQIAFCIQIGVTVNGRPVSGDAVPVGNVGRDVTDSYGIVTGETVVVEVVVGAVEGRANDGHSGEPLREVLPPVELRVEKAVAAARESGCQRCSNECMNEDFLHCYSS